MRVIERYLKAKYTTRLQFLAFYKHIDWHVNNNTKVSQDLYGDYIQKKPTEVSKLNESTMDIDLKPSLNMSVYQSH